MPGVAESGFCTLGGVLLTIGAVGVGACGTSSSSAGADAAVGIDASLYGSDATDAAADRDAPESIACAVPEDCTGVPTGPVVSCCINKACVSGEAAVDALNCTDADVELILASNYDQSCHNDSDCVGVAEGNFCVAGAGNCASAAAINKGAYSQYQADVAKTNAAICRAASSCGSSFGPCCRHGLCQMGVECADSGAPPEGEAGADAGDGSAE
jgi:hypothetical protein